MDAYLQALLADQSGTVARQQLLACGAADHDIRRWLRRRDLVRLHRGVFVDHTGAPTWLQRAWAAVLVMSAYVDGQPWGSALGRESALRLLDGPGSPLLEIHGVRINVDASRFIVPPRGVVVERTVHFAERTTYRMGMPCMRYEDALIDVAGGLNNWDSFALLATAIGSRRTTADRVERALADRAWVLQRRWLSDAIADIGLGTCSVLERGFLHGVLRAHGLPRPRQQHRDVTPIGIAYRDFAIGRLIIELDGRAFHSAPQQRDADLERDLVAAVGGQQTIRLGWGQVYRSPCQTAAAVARLIGAEGRSCGAESCRIPAAR